MDVVEGAFCPRVVVFQIGSDTDAASFEADGLWQLACHRFPTDFPLMMSWALLADGKSAAMSRRRVSVRIENS